MPTPALMTGNALTEAYMTLKTSNEAPGKKEQSFDNLSNNVGDKPTLSFINNFYEANQSAINSAATGIASLESGAIDNAISTFGENIKIVLNGLDALSHIHPAIGVAIVAFKLVVSLDITRRENNQKVMAVRIQIQQMLCTLFHLRRFQDPAEVMPDGTILKDRLQPLMEQIARDIKECGSACDVYLKKSFIAKTIKSKIYEARLADYAIKFIEYRDQLDKSLTVHIAVGVDMVNKKLDAQASTLLSIKDKLESLFRKLDTPREREVIEYIERNGGAKAVIERSDLVEGLIKRSGETVADLADKTLTSKNDIDSVKEKLRKELAEDVDVVLGRNLTLFSQKMELQDRNIKEALEKHGKNIVDAVSGGTHSKIKDSDLQNVWKDMGRKGSVKARNFVLALRDYFTEKFSGTPNPEASEISMPQPIFSATQQSAAQVDSPYTRALGDDRWALEYFNLSNIQPILEAIDDDGTGFISIREANTFASERPMGWSLLHWIAFWAKGWETSLAEYKNKIFLVLQEMSRLRRIALPANLYFVEIYIGHYTLVGVESILRPTRTDYSPTCPELAALTHTYMDAEEQRLQTSLEEIGYDLDSPATVTLITGPGRIERYLFPLLYLMLKRHLEVFRYACRHIVDPEEFPHMSATLQSIFRVVDQRIASLRVIYEQIHIDIKIHLQKCALGMFHDIAVTGYRYGSRESLIPYWSDTSRNENRPQNAELAQDVPGARPLFAQNPEAQDNYHAEWQGWPPHSFDTNNCSGAIDGFWTGQIFARRGNKPVFGSGLMQLKIEIDPEDHKLLKGVAVSHFGKLEIYGRRRWVGDTGSAFEQFDIIMMFVPPSTAMRLIGRFVKGLGALEELVGELTMLPNPGYARHIYDTHPFGVNPTFVERVERRGSDDEGQAGRTSDDEGEDIPGREGDPKDMDHPDSDADNNVMSKGEATPHAEAEDIPNAEAEDTPNAEAEDTPNAEADPEPAGNGPLRNTVTTEAGSDDEERLDAGFVLRRAPVEVFRFRHILYKASESKAKSRWEFLREVVLHIIQSRRWSWRYFKAWSADRRAFLDYAKRDRLTWLGFVIQNPLTPEDLAAWWDLRNRVSPAPINLCNEASKWSIDRLSFHYGITCDGCHLRLIESRFTCLTCLDSEMSNSFDLCSRCMNKPAERYDFTHTVDHTLIKAEQHIHEYYFVWLINEARLKSTRLKKAFAEPQWEQGTHGFSNHNTPMGGRSELLCGCCAKPVKIPFWVCLTCIPETYICSDCQKDEKFVMWNGPGSSDHRTFHHLLRIHNLKPARFEREKLDPTATRVSALESAVGEQFGALESRINTRFAALETRMTGLETKIEEHLTSKLESMFKRIAQRLGIPEDVESTESDTAETRPRGDVLAREYGEDLASEVDMPMRNDQ
ncbi:hypothetical protein P691DRAFT_777225 [Macrolepiota fuliginosa MF-IS2]|uniref:ZZ-type domain-containing protein n=1 Tax=Macrolepiota fuliginosa MF-IS2 TaxID=1400762 RepID=A0A9P5XAV7_9AGAR|nr:hypothetical protein P691DRAFT_777225 [Macrolepiota fuliginosa MF-IS2]